MRELPAPTVHYEGVTAAEQARRLDAERRYLDLLRGQVGGSWFAALVESGPAGEPGELGKTFASWGELLEFLAARDALVEVWAYGAGIGGRPRRLSASELAARAKQPYEAPTFITVTYPDVASGRAVKRRVVFGLQAAQRVAAAHRAYRKHRDLQRVTRRILNARDDRNRHSARAQREAWKMAAQTGEVSAVSVPVESEEADDVYLAFEFEVDESGNFVRAVRGYRESEITGRIEGDEQHLVLAGDGNTPERVALGFRYTGVSGSQRREPNPVQGEEVVELRVVDPHESDARRWNVLEFGEPALLRESVLARFALLNAHLEGRRKRVMLRRSDIGLIAEPIIAGLNIGAGAAGVPFPVGEAVRLAYNVALMKFGPSVPTAREMRRMFAMMAARDLDPELKAKPERLLTDEELQALDDSGRALSDAELRAYLARISDADIDAMQRLARMGRLDMQITDVLNILASALKVTGAAESGDVMRGLFNNVFVSPNGEIYLSSILLVALGQRDATGLSGVSLQQLIDGEGPTKAWLQYFGVTVDIRAIINTVHRLFAKTRAAKELYRPLPYATELADLAAYEFRVFGFPLLMYYKRGLIKRDLEAYENDYAYGVVGRNIVEHFETRAELEAEVRAGRVVPLGYVKVRDGKGGWKETRLAVFAHRLAQGKHRGRTALILYGLRAFEEHSELVERELQRFRQFEETLERGGVITHVVRTEGDVDSRVRGFEPFLLTGSEPRDRVFSPLLADLIELRRAALLRDWGRPLAPDELRAVDEIRRRLAGRHVVVGEGNPLVEVDRHHSAFVYWREFGSDRRKVKVTAVPSLEDIERAVRKAEDAVLVEQARRRSLTGGSAGLILLNEVREVEGHLEPGPLRRDAAGNALGVGLLQGEEAFEGLMESVGRLSVVEQARLEYNRFAATQIELPLGERAEPERVFLTIEFPLGPSSRERVNPASGEAEVIHFEAGQWRRTVTDRRLVEVEYDPAGRERGTRTYANRGTRHRPVAGELIESTRTLSMWYRDLSRPGIDAHEPIIEKLRVNYITGRVSRERYGLFPLPVESVDELYVTVNRYDRFGRLRTATVYENDAALEAGEAAVWEGLLAPRRGSPRFELSALPDPGTNGPPGRIQALERRDLARGTSRTGFYDRARDGRRTGAVLAPLPGEPLPGIVITNRYRDDFHHGLIPVGSTSTAAGSEVVLAETATVSFDPGLGQVVAMETDYTGLTLRKTWERRWSEPTRAEGFGRSTVYQYNRQGTSVTSTTTAVSTGEVVATANGVFDLDLRQWRVERTVWHRAEIPRRTERVVMDRFGRTLTTRVGDTLEIRQVYDEWGRASGTTTHLSGPEAGGESVLVRQEDICAWEQGRSDARVRTYVEGTPYDEFWTATDELGRTTTDGLRTNSLIELRTEILHDGQSERVSRAQVFQNGVLRAEHEPLPERRNGEGHYDLPVRVRPFWGLVSTNYYRLDDPLGRQHTVVFENGDVSAVEAWLPGTAVARSTRLNDRNGRPKRRFVRRIDSATDAGAGPGRAFAEAPYDSVDAYGLDPWGGAGFAGTIGLVRGTDIGLFRDAAGLRVFFDTTKPYPAPGYATDRSGRLGLTVRVGDVTRSNVVAVFEHKFGERKVDPQTEANRERVLRSTRIDLRGLFYHAFTESTFDRGGNPLSEFRGRISHLGPDPYATAVLFARAARVEPHKRFTYEYRRGWLVEEEDTDLGVTSLGFATGPARDGGPHWPVNEEGRRDWATEILGQQRTSEEGLEMTGLRRYRFERVHRPRLLRGNPYLPNTPNVWHAWTSQALDEEGKLSFESTLIQDAMGQAATQVAVKRNSHGRPGRKVTYRLPDAGPHLWSTNLVVASDGKILLNPQGPLDLADDEFVAVWVGSAGEPGRLRFVDGNGRAVGIAAESADEGSGTVSYWPTGGDVVQWLPNSVIPRRGAVLRASSPPGEADATLLAVSVAELARAGIDTRKVSRVEWEPGATWSGEPRVSKLLECAHNGAALRLDRREVRGRRQSVHSSGLALLERGHRGIGRDGEPDLQWTIAGSFQGLNALRLRLTNERPPTPMAVVMDASDPNSPRPLYAVSPETGEFLEYYRTFRIGDTQVYTVSPGYRVPRVEVFRSGILDDEISPGLVGYGHGYDLAVPMAKGATWPGKAIARLGNRMAASPFTLAHQKLTDALVGPTPARQRVNRLTQNLGDAEQQARAIGELPTLAQALLPRRSLPWDEGGVPTSPVPETLVATNRLGAHLLDLSVRIGSGGEASGRSRTGLVLTSPGSPDERFVDTVSEAAIIQLAIRLGEFSTARRALEFYWQASRGGEEALHASYDAATGASAARDARYARAVDAARTAEAQIAMAEAALGFGAATGDRRSIGFGRNLLALALSDYRLPATASAPPRGIFQDGRPEVRQVPGIQLWPEPAEYPVRINARAYLLLRQFGDLLAEDEAEADDPLLTASGELERWLRERILPEAARTGVVPSGLFEVQDFGGGKTAEAIQRWTRSEDWLYFIEAAKSMGVGPRQLRTWLANLARVHGVRVGDAWGLDWGLALDRPDAISIELTARFARVARLVGETSAAAYALRQVQDQRRDGLWPTVVTAGEEPPVLPTTQGMQLRRAVARPAEGGGAASGFEWPECPAVALQFFDADWPTGIVSGPGLAVIEAHETDMARFFWTAAAFYLSILAVTLLWWGLSAYRKRVRAGAGEGSRAGCLVPAAVMQAAEERWAKRVLGVKTPAGAPSSRFANGAVEQNFHMQLRAIYKLVLEWRRLANGWSADDPRLVEEGRDEWLNGMDEFAAMIGIYSRWVVKAGRKDGGRRDDVLEENEDSNHVWSRLVMYLSETHWGLLELMKKYVENPAAAEFYGTDSQIQQLLGETGLHARLLAFDARERFDVPDNEAALDLLVIQAPGATLKRVVAAMEEKLGIPRDHVIGFLRRYKDFKEREELYPIHPYLIEVAKTLPHFLLMGLVALIWHNLNTGGPSVYEDVGRILQDTFSLAWVGPVLLGTFASLVAFVLSVYRHRGRLRSPSGPRIRIEDTVTEFFRSAGAALPTLREGRWWEPVWWKRAGWILRAAGFAWLGIALWLSEPVGFASFTFVKGVLAVLLLAEAAATIVPLGVSSLSRRLEDYVSNHTGAPAPLRFLNQLNLTPTRPASILWLSLRYHFRPSVPTGGSGAVVRSIVSYFVFTGLFLLIGGYLCTQALKLWFLDTYLSGNDFRLLIGGLLFWNVIYLLRFAIFVLLAAFGAAFTVFPIRVTGAIAASVYVVWGMLDGGVAAFVSAHPVWVWSAALLGVASMLFEPELLRGLGRRGPFRRRAERAEGRTADAIEAFRNDPGRALGIVYMSGDELSYRKLAPELLMSRLSVLRNQLGSPGLKVLSAQTDLPADDVLRAQFEALYALERQADVTLWHPLQLRVEGETSPHLAPELGLHLTVESREARGRLLRTWHLRRWLVTMMSTAGHSQDTGINLVDIALRLREERLTPNTVFYLIQNKYDDRADNRPSQLSYREGELGQREKLARLLAALAPGSRAYSVNDWTPFGFKAGGMVGMDLVHEESLKLVSMVVMDRNANVHDLDALMEDIQVSLGDPGAVIVVPGRGTTNTLTPLGQGSQLLEEGHRALTRGVGFLGGEAGETLGTGWGNIQAVYYGRVQRALCDPDMPRMPLTSRARRGVPFGDRFEGLIGFGPHAVGISEDIWGVTQAAHNAIALGQRVSFHRSRAFWHKIRETWSHAEWFSAFPRWAGGYLQMMSDPLMQRINDFGSLSVFAKELRANGGRFFLGAPAALLSVLLMPLAIIFDVSPFVQFLILLWNLGLVMNQILTALGLIASLERTGFNRVTAMLGGVASASVAWLTPALRPLAPGLTVLGVVGGGFVIGLGRWLYDRGRDMLLFGPQLVIHTLGQLVRQSLEFVLSGAAAEDARGVNVAYRAWAGPREDRPSQRYANVVNLRTVVWGIGLASVVLNLVALANLDFMNVVLLLPTLMFSVSTLLGPFLMAPRAGDHLRNSVWAPKLLGWLASLGLYLATAGLISLGGWWTVVGGVSVPICFGLIAARGLRYWNFAGRLRRMEQRTSRELSEAGLPADQAGGLARQIVFGLGGDGEKTRAAAAKAGLKPAARDALAEMAEGVIRPLVERPAREARGGRFANSRFACECGRSFVLAMFTLVWFFIVPIPGLIALTAPDGLRFSLTLSSMIGLLGGIVATALMGLLISRSVGCLVARGLRQRSAEAYRRLERLTSVPTESASFTSALYALFTDFQTYYDQRSYAYASRCLDQVAAKIEARGRTSSPKQPPECRDSPFGPSRGPIGGENPGR